MGISQCLWAWILGAVAGLFAVRRCRRCDEPLEVRRRLKFSAERQGSMKPPRLPLLVARHFALPAPMLVCGALRRATHPGEAWGSAAVSVCLLASLGMTVGALFGNARRRPFCGGFAVCCGGYSLLFLFTATSWQTNYYLDSAVTTRALKLLHDRLFPDSSVKLFPQTGGGFGGGGFGGGGAFDVGDDTDPFSSPE